MYPVMIISVQVPDFVTLPDILSTHEFLDISP